MDFTKKSTKSGLLSKALSLKLNVEFESLKMNFKDIYKAFLSISNTINANKSMLLFFDPETDSYNPVYNKGYSFSTFTRISLPKNFTEFMETRSFLRQFSHEDKVKNDKIYWFCFRINNINFLFFSTDFSGDQNKIITTEIVRSGIRNITIKKTELFSNFTMPVDQLTVTYVNTTYLTNNKLHILRNEGKMFTELSQLFSTNSYILRKDFSKLIILSQYSFYPEPSTFQMHIEDFLRTGLTAGTKNRVETFLTDVDHVNMIDILKHND